MRPGGCTSRMIEKAVSDLPLPDSPTSPRVSPGRTAKLTSLTAGTNRPLTVKPVVRCSTASSAAVSDIDLGVLPEHGAERVGDLADRRAGLDRTDDGRHEVVGTPGDRLHELEHFLA